MAQFTYLKGTPTKAFSKDFDVLDQKFKIDGVMVYTPIADVFSRAEENTDKPLHERNAADLKKFFKSLNCNGKNVFESDADTFAFCSELNVIVSDLFRMTSEYNFTAKAKN